MSYSPKQLYQTFAATGTSPAQEDAFIGTFVAFLGSAGWGVTPANSAFTLTTTNSADSFFFLGGSGRQDLYKLTNPATGKCVLIIDAPPPGYISPCALGFISTGGAGVTDPADIHAALRTGMSELFPTYAQIKVDGTTTRFITDTPTNNPTLPNIGGQIETADTGAIGGGYVCTSQPSITTYFSSGKTTAGSQNYIQLFFTQVRPDGANQTLPCVAASKGFAGFPLDTLALGGAPAVSFDAQQPGGVAGTYSGPQYSQRTGYGYFEGGGFLTRAFANPYQLIAHTEDNTGATKQILMAGGLKLMDFRRSFNVLLPITEATYFICSLVSGGATSLRNGALVIGGNRLWCSVNDNMRYESGGHASNQGDPRIMTLESANLNDSSATSVLGIPWDDGCAEIFEPWFGYNPFTSTGVPGVVGQLWDTITLFETTASPDSAATFTWDGQIWQKYSKGVQLASFPGNTPAMTMCGRKTN